MIVAKKQNITQAQAREWADTTLASTEDLLTLIEEITKGNVDDFDLKGMKIAQTLAVVAQRASEAAASVLSHCGASEQNRRLAAMEGK